MEEGTSSTRPKLSTKVLSASGNRLRDCPAALSHSQKISVSDLSEHPPAKNAVRTTVTDIKYFPIKDIQCILISTQLSIHHQYPDYNTDMP